MKRTTWTERDLNDLRYGVAHFSNDDLSILLGKTRYAIDAKIYQLGISRIKRRRYSKRDEELIETTIGIRPLKDVAKELGRKPNDIYCKVFKMALNAPIHRKAA